MNSGISGKTVKIGNAIWNFTSLTHDCAHNSGNRNNITAIS